MPILIVPSLAPLLMQVAPLLAPQRSLERLIQQPLLSLESALQPVAWLLYLASQASSSPALSQAHQRLQQPALEPQAASQLEQLDPWLSMSLELTLRSTPNGLVDQRPARCQFELRGLVEPATTLQPPMVLGREQLQGLPLQVWLSQQPVASDQGGLVAGIPPTLSSRLDSLAP